MINFITFGSHDNYIQAGNRLIEQASRLNIFNNINLFTIEDLKNDTIFWNQHKDFILGNSKGFGYWIWKPYLIKKKINEMNDGDILLYLDCGCEIESEERDYFSWCINQVKKDYIIGTLGKTNVEESCKMDLLLYLDMNYPIYLKTKMHQAGANLIYINSQTRKLVNEWYNISCNYHFINDDESINKNLELFKEHRHDQSIYCLLTKKYNIYSKYNLGKMCIKYIRNRTGNSVKTITQLKL